MAKSIKNTYFIERYETPVPSSLDVWKVAFPPKVIELLIKDFSKKNDVVFDPFAGFGTSVMIAKKLGRKAFGTEIDKEPIKFAKKEFNVNLIEKSAFDIDLNKHPVIDLCIFSPPYWGPALGAKTYSGYIKKIGLLVDKIQNRMSTDAHLIVLIQNYQTEKGLLTLAWDVGNEVKKRMKLEQDIMWCIDRTNSKRDAVHEAADHHYCLIFTNQKK